MTPASASKKVTWKFGDRVEDADAWLKHPTELHVYVDFRSPKTPPEQWHRIMTVTHAWVEKQLAQRPVSSVWPAMLVVRDGTRSEIEANIESVLQDGWPLVVDKAGLLPKGYQPVKW